MKIKAIFFLAIICLLSKASAYSQRHELSIGAGVMSRPFIMECTNLRKLMGTAPDNTQYFGTFQLNYRFNPGKNYSIGASLAYEYQGHDKTSSYPYPGYEDDHHIYREYYTSLLATQRYSWVNGKQVMLYSALDLGACLVNRQEAQNDSNQEDGFTKTRFAYQITPFGIRVGKRFGGYAEIGYGYKGILSAGFSYRF